MSFPAAALIARVHSVPSILIALATMVGGCLVMLAAANLAVYPLVLLGLFMLASGITVLQVAANPLAAALGDPKRSHFRLTLSDLPQLPHFPDRKSGVSGRGVSVRVDLGGRRMLKQHKQSQSFTRS